ncbi:MAG: hypothetical protein CMK74_00595 [Pseudomonadales bacterium]|nr:hypothetical protein [Pseudomonadales bacterium]|tara:strand:- start:707 stop:937 length:231 start_codon:yes stop_codon:yes gene_type:complete
MFLLKTATPVVRQNLRFNLHKVAAHIANQGRFPLSSDEVTLKEAAYLIGTHAHYSWLTKRAALDGIVNAVRLGQDL